ncbi:MAG TPA: hypothetical protein DEO32_01115, partial [Ruminococcaceae bacterium]|nr:hypothetical protein [Oscillospiraceae bacterium]
PVEEMPEKAAEAAENTAKQADKKESETQSKDIPLELQNALECAENYLKSSPFSKEALYKQLIYENLTQEQASFAVNNLKTDWNEQALLTAKGYLKNTDFSKDDLREQLIFEKFTSEQAQYAIDRL